VIEPIFEVEFAEGSYGFRPGRGCHDALREVDRLIKEGFTHVVDADLASYFDTIPHDRLVARIEERVIDGQVLDLKIPVLLANPEAQGPTVWQRIEAPQSTVSRRVDFILFLNGRKSTASVLSSRIVLDRPGQLPNGSTLWPSDHYGVLAELEILPVNRAQANRR